MIWQNKYSKIWALFIYTVFGLPCAGIYAASNTAISLAVSMWKLMEVTPTTTFKVGVTAPPLEAGIALVHESKGGQYLRVAIFRYLCSRNACFVCTSMKWCGGISDVPHCMNGRLLSPQACRQGRAGAPALLGSRSLFRRHYDRYTSRCLFYSH